jgi:hypothetical protein
MINARTIEKIKAVEFQDGNVRSLAMSLKKVVDMTEAWNIAKAVADGNVNFNKTDLISYVDANMKVVEKQNTKSYIEGEELLKIAMDESKSKNARFRELYKKGCKVSAIANTMDVTYQRVQNIVKKMKKKGEA